MTELRRTMRLPDATAMVVGIIIGASIFVQPSEITRLVPDAGGIALVWALAGVLTLIGALICAELSSAFPRTGGVYVFLRDIFGAPVGFLWGWAMFWSMHTGIIAAIAVVFARYVGYFVPLGPTGIRVVAAIAVLGLSAFNCLGIRHGSRLQTIVTGAKLAPRDTAPPRPNSFGLATSLGRLARQPIRVTITVRSSDARGAPHASRAKSSPSSRGLENIGQWPVGRSTNFHSGPASS